MSQSQSQNPIPTPPEFRHRDHVVNIFNLVFNGAVPHPNIVAKHMYHLIYSFLPGIKFKDITLRQACRINLDLVRLWLRVRNRTGNVIVQPEHFKIALVAGKVDIARFLYQVYLRNMPYRSGLLSAAIESGKLESIALVKTIFDQHQHALHRQALHQHASASHQHVSASHQHASHRHVSASHQHASHQHASHQHVSHQHEADDYQSWHNSNEGYFIREKLLMLKELRHVLGITPIIPIGDIDPDTTICKYQFTDVEHYFSSKTNLDITKYLIAAGYSFNDSDIMQDGLLGQTDINICKYFYLRLPCVFNEVIINTDFFVRTLNDAISRGTNVDIIEWLLELHPTDHILDQNSDVIVNTVCSWDRVDVLILLETRWHFPVSPPLMEIGKHSAMKIFDYYQQTRGFSPEELQTIFDSSIDSYRTDLYLKLITDYQMMPELSGLEASA